MNVNNFKMKCQAIIGNHYFDITVGFQCTYMYFWWGKSLSGHAKTSLSPSLKSVIFYLARKRKKKRRINVKTILY